MICSDCRNRYADRLAECPHCNAAKPLDWEDLATVYSPEDSVLQSMLEGYGIPVMLRSRESIGRVQGLTLGPLAEIIVMVPREFLSDAQQLMSTDVSVVASDDAQ